MRFVVVAAVPALLLMACAQGQTASEGEGDGDEGDAEGEGEGAAEGEGEGESSVPSIGGCPVFPADDPWNQDVLDAVVDEDWTTRLQSFTDVDLHPDFGNVEDEHFGIPINVVPEGTTRVSISFDFDDESDAGPYPIPDPDEVLVEGGSGRDCSGDCHILVVEQGACTLFEAFGCLFDGGWRCGSGAIFDMARVSEGQRPLGLTSADAAGLSITAGLARYDEAAAGLIPHALRFTTHCTQNHFVSPASHHAVPEGCDDDDDGAPPMGLRVRLRSDFSEVGFSPIPLAFIHAMKIHGMILADNGSDFFFQSADDPRWTDDLDELKDIPSSAFEAVDVGLFLP